MINLDGPGIVGNNEENLDENKKANILETMKIIINHKSDLTKWNNANESILSMAYKIGDEGYFLNFINGAEPIDFLKHQCGKNFIIKMVNEKKTFMLLKTLDLCLNLHMYNEFLLDLSLKALKNKDEISFRIILNRCNDKNVLLNNGETFLSNLIKTGEKESLIKSVIESKYFDLNVINKNKETLLIVAIKKFLINTVKTLIQNGCDVAYNNVEAAQVTVEVKTQTKLEKNKVIADNILKLLFESKEVIIDNQPIVPPLNENELMPKIDHGLYEKKIVELISLLFVHKGQLEICNNENKSVLSLAYNLHDKKFFGILLENYDKELNIFANEFGNSLVQEITKLMDWNNLMKILDRNVKREEDSIQFLNLAHIALVNNEMDIYTRIINKCFNKNTYLSNGETFLTNIFSSNINEEILLTVIKSNMFDLKQPNQRNQTPLILACQHLMPNIVELLMGLGSDIAFNSFQALEIILKASEDAKNEDNDKKKNKIFSIFLNLKKKQLIAIADDLHNISVINPEFIINVEGKQVKEKIIILQCNQKRNILKLRWKGLVDDRYCLGCITVRKTDFGTNGTFANVSLFTCEDKHGILIPLDSVTECCVKTGHKIIKDMEGLLDENSICCIKVNQNQNNHIKIHDYISRKENGVYATCKWIGMMNEVEVIGVQLEHQLNGARDGMFCTLQLFQCPEKCGAFFKFNEFNKAARYTSKIIPPEFRIFQNIEINTPVKYYFNHNETFKDLYGTVKWSGVNEKGEYLYGIELDDRFAEGTDGVFQDERLFQCKNGYGVLVSIELIGKDTRFIEEEFTRINDELSQESTVHTLCIGKKLIEGLNKGIQGTKLSFFECLLFSLFVKSDALDYLIRCKSHNITNEFQNSLATKIVYPLRKFGFVSHHRIEEINKCGLKLIDSIELDSEKYFEILSKLCPDEQLIRMVSLKYIETCSMHLQLPLTLGNKLKFMNTEEMLHFSMILNDLMFIDLPSCLIIKVPRDIPNGTKFCEFLIPSNIIEISNLCSNYYRKCSQCNNEATYQCKKCIENTSNVNNSFTCLNHQCDHAGRIAMHLSHLKSKSKVFMDLGAIICHNGSNFVSYVKQIGIESYDPKWYFFDTMTSQAKPNNNAAPKVAYSIHASNFLNQSTQCKKDVINSYPYDNIKDIIENSHVFVYYNSTKTCY